MKRLIKQAEAIETVTRQVLQSLCLGHVRSGEVQEHHTVST